MLTASTCIDHVYSIEFPCSKSGNFPFLKSLNSTHVSYVKLTEHELPVAMCNTMTSGLSGISQTLVIRPSGCCMEYCIGALMLLHV